MRLARALGAALSVALRERVVQQAASLPRFIKQLADNALRNRPPLNWLGGIETHEVGGRACVDLKFNGTAIFVDVARLYALAHGVAATNTRERFEALGPLIELVGYTLLLLGAVLGLISWQAFVAYLVLAAGLGLLLSASALLLEEMSFRVYPDVRHLLQLSGALLIENLGYRQLTLLWRISGIFKWLIGRPAKWGDMRRLASWHAPKTGP